MSLVLFCTLTYRCSEVIRALGHIFQGSGCKEASCQWAVEFVALGSILLCMQLLVVVNQLSNPYCYLFRFRSHQLMLFISNKQKLLAKN